MKNGLDLYQRLEFDGQALYFRRDWPDWFVPSQRADELLRQYQQTEGDEEQRLNPRLNNILTRLYQQPAPEYLGRAVYRQLTHLKEYWIHITNHCNMACQHCLFSACQTDTLSIDETLLMESIKEALSLGCHVFYFTGGEPFVYPNFTAVCDFILKQSNAHIVIMTNGKGLDRFDAWLRSADPERIHLQISIDGMQANHEKLRGPGTFSQLQETLAYLRPFDFSLTLAMAVTKSNVREMADIITFSARHKIPTVHYMWLFLKGAATKDLFVPPDEIFENFRQARIKAESLGVRIDNIDIIQAQAFNFPGSRFDLSNAGWESLAIGPDGNIYPSAALVLEESLIAGHASEGLKKIWETSPVMHNLRRASVVESTALKDNVLCYFLGGGDLDHSYTKTKQFVDGDPYLPLYEKILLDTIVREARTFPDTGQPTLLTRMGEKILECNEESATVGFTHSNCVLTIAGQDARAKVRSFYSRAAEDLNEDIVNPVHYDLNLINHIPQRARVRSYGCGSPVLDCGLKRGEVLVDLGSGTGVECFIAAKQTGPAGHVYGIDMSDTMLSLAREAQQEVAASLGYANVDFRKGFLEEIPVETGTVDVVISNCVINLSVSKRKTFQEIFRILKPTGRIFISDIVHCDEIPLEIKLSEKLRGECIGGAMHENQLFGMLEDFGFENIRVVKRFVYRHVQEYPFYSITYSASRPHPGKSVDIIYRGPFAGVVMDENTIIYRGRKATIDLPEGLPLSDDFMLLNQKGEATNLAGVSNSCCAAPAPVAESSCCSSHPSTVVTPQNVNPEAEEASYCCSVETASALSAVPKVETCDCAPQKSHTKGCLVCGKELQYFDQPKAMSCTYCGKELLSECCCEDGHFICDACHVAGYIRTIQIECLQSTEKDVIALFKGLRAQPSFPMHGPHHHAMIPGIILAAYRNNGGDITDQDILTGINRGRTVPGGSCGFYGIDGAAVGLGIAFSLILKSNPNTPKKRQIVQQIVAQTALKIAEYEAARCCQREGWTALLLASQFSKDYTAHNIPADAALVCEQFRTSLGCLGKRCPLHKGPEQHSLSR